MTLDLAATGWKLSCMFSWSSLATTRWAEGRWSVLDWGRAGWRIISFKPSKKERRCQKLKFMVAQSIVWSSESEKWKSYRGVRVYQSRQPAISKAVSYPFSVYFANIYHYYFLEVIKASIFYGELSHIWRWGFYSQSSRWMIFNELGVVVNPWWSVPVSHSESLLYWIQILNSPRILSFCLPSSNLWHFHS